MNSKKNAPAKQAHSCYTPLMNDEINMYAKKIWDYMHMHHTVRPMDVIFALGSNDLRVANRAGELYLQGYGKYVICAGGNGKGSRLNEPEAEAFARVVNDMGVPFSNIIKEPNSSNTGENIHFTKQLLKEKVLEFNSFILVQKPYMERRTYATFSKQWPGKECIVTSPSFSYEDYETDETSKIRFINTMVGDLIRIKEYPKQGFQIEQDIPEDVWEAGQRLAELGFNKYVL